MKSYKLLKEYIESILSEKKVTSKTLKSAYKSGKKGKGTKRSIASMAREINKCADPNNRPASCYDYWDADKQYDKAKKKKKLKESDDFEQSYIIVYPNFQGADVPEDYNSSNYSLEFLPTNLMIGNEPDKDRNYFMSTKRDYIQKMINDVNQYGLETIPPVVAIQHPLISGYYSVLDGNHRLGAFKIAGIKKIPAIIVDEADVFLASPDTEWFEGINADVISLINAIQNNYNLNIYFNTKDLR
jgi:hypothetical protein